MDCGVESQVEDWRTPRRLKTKAAPRGWGGLLWTDGKAQSRPVFTVLVPAGFWVTEKRRNLRGRLNCAVSDPLGRNGPRKITVLKRGKKSKTTLLTCLYEAGWELRSEI